MPEMSGLEMCKQVKNSLHLSHIPFVMVTCRNELAAKRAAISAGASEFISKPVPLSLLLSKVNQLITQQGKGQA
ncbi:MAG: response regulator, partial [Bacteroidota bacterium]